MHPFSGEAACLHFVTRVSPDSDPLYSASPNNCHFFTVAYGELLSSATLHDADKRWLEAMFGLECGALSGDGSLASSSGSACVAVLSYFGLNGPMTGAKIASVGLAVAGILVPVYSFSNGGLAPLPP